MEQKGKIGIHKKIDRLTSIVEKTEQKKEKKKGWRLPFSIRIKAKSIAKKKKALIFSLRTNRNIDIRIADIYNGMVLVDDKYYDARADCFYIYKGIPTMILPEWSLAPIGTADYYKAIENKESSHSQQTIIRAIETKEAMKKKKLSGKTVIWLLIAAAVAFYLVTNLGQK